MAARLAQGDALVDAFSRFGLSWIELSRHHPDDARNQTIMRFRPGEPITDGDAFATVARRLRGRFPLRLVCIVQRGGIDDADGVAAYLRWAATLGAGTVIFREFSRLDDGYRDNATRRHVDAARVPMPALVDAVLASPLRAVLMPIERTAGYYFDNLRLRHREIGRAHV